MKSETRTIPIRFPIELHRKMGHALVDTGGSVQGLVVELVQKWVEERQSQQKDSSPAPAVTDDQR